MAPDQPPWMTGAAASGTGQPHLVHDPGAFQLGLGLTLLLAVVWRDGLALALAGFLVANTAHALTHAVDPALGGHSSDPWALAALSLLTAAALVARLHQLGWVGGEATTATISALARLARQTTVLVTTDRHDGRPVGTRPAWPSTATTPISAASSRPEGPDAAAPPGGDRAAGRLAAKHPLPHGLLAPLPHRLGRAKTDKTAHFQPTPLNPGQAR